MGEIRTARLLLRRARPDDLAAIHAILSDAVAMRYWSTLPHATLAESRVWLEGMIATSAEESDDYVVERNGRVIGKMGAWRLPEIGFIFAPDCWGQGYAAEALRAFIDHAFAGRADHLIADVDPRNQASLKLLGRAGFVESGRAARTYLVGGGWCDSIYLRLDRPARAASSR